MGRTVAAAVERVCETGTAREAVEALAEMTERALVAGDQPPGCPVAAVALAAEDADGRLRDAAHRVFEHWARLLAGPLRREGLRPADARARATLVVAALEGAVLLCRAARSRRPLQEVRRALVLALPEPPAAPPAIPPGVSQKSSR